MIGTVLIALGIAAAQSSTVSPSNTIVVTGDGRLDEGRARLAVEAISADGAQLARFHRPVCPLVFGMADDGARAIEQRIRRIAQDVGAAVAAPACAANFVIILTDDNQKAFADIRSRTRDSIDGMSSATLARLLKERGPVLAWSATTVRNEDGFAISSIDKVNPQNLRVQSASILRPTTRQDIDGSVIIINRAAAMGKTLGQLANYAAMRGLAQTRPPAADTINSILNLFIATTPPLSLTAFDSRYLKGLYAASGKDTAQRERRRLAQVIASGS